MSGDLCWVPPICGNYQATSVQGPAAWDPGLRVGLRAFVACTAMTALQG